MLLKFEKSIYSVSLLLLLYLSSGSLNLFLEGGAHQQGVINQVQHHGPLTLILRIWFPVSGLLVLWAYFVRATSKQLAPNIFILALLAFSAASALWADSPYQALRMSGLIAVSYALIFASKVYFTKEQLYLLICHFLFVMMAASAVFSLFIPSYGVSVDNSLMWQGVFAHKNTLGNFCAAAFVIFLCGNERSINIFYQWLGVSLAVFLVFMSKSTTSILAVLVSLFVYILINKEFLRKWLASNRNLFFLAVLFCSFLLVVFALYGEHVQILQKDSSFSERDIIWQTVLAKVANSPILGYGLEQFKIIFLGEKTRLLYMQGVGVASAHNGFIDLTFSLGITGLVIFIVIMHQLISKNNFCPLTVCFFVAFVVINTFEVRLWSFNIFIVLMFFFISYFNHPASARSN